MSIELEIEKSLSVLEKGGTLLCPTDTIWGLSADAENEQAVDKVFQIKNRPKEKRMIVLVSSIDMLRKYVAEIPDISLQLIKESKTPISIVYPKAKNVAKNVMHPNGSLAIRIVQDDFCKALIEQFGKAIISTSANVSGKPTPQSFSEIEEEILNKVDYCVELSAKKLQEGKSSSLFLLEGDGYRQLR